MTNHGATAVPRERGPSPVRPMRTGGDQAWFAPVAPPGESGASASPRRADQDVGEFLSLIDAVAPEVR